MDCRNCGEVNSDQNSFCIHCGTAVEAAAPRPQPSKNDALVVKCVSGPDAGQAYAVGAEEVVLGRMAGIGLADPDVADEHVVLSYQAGRLQFQAQAHAPIHVNGMAVLSGSLPQGQKFRMGGSIWEVGQSRYLPQVLENFGSRLNQLAGTDPLEGFSLREMFSDVFKKRSEEEIDDYFTVGTARTTPAISAVQSGWPKPWFFLRVLTFVAVIYFGFHFALNHFRNVNLIPGLIIMGSLAVPLATVFLFFELNTPRNVSFHRVLMLVALGGIVSLIVSLFGFGMFQLSWLGASEAGIVEEAGKLLAVVLIVRHAKFKYILNGLLFGAAVGAGFAIFESAGYAFTALLTQKSTTAMNANIQLRAFLSPFGHVAWTAITAGALWRSSGGAPRNFKALAEIRFWKAFLIPVALHMIWNSPFPSVFYLKYLALGAISWFVVFGMVQQGLRQVRDEQRAATASRRPATSVSHLALGA